MVSLSKQQAFRYAQLASVATVIAGVIGVIGWFLRWEWLIQPRQNDAAFTLTASLTVIAVGGAALGTLGSRRSVAMVSGGALILLSALTFLIETTGGPGWLEHIGPAEHFTTASQLPGQMSVLTAICGAIVAVATLVQGVVRRGSDAIVVPAVGYSVVVAIGVVVLIGYVSGLGSDVPWSRFAGMSYPVAAGFILGGGALGVFSWLQAPRREGRLPRWSWAPLVIASLAGTAVSVLIVSRHETEQAYAFMASEAEQAAATVDGRTAASVDALARLLAALSEQWEITEGEWRRASFDFGSDVPGLLALQLETPERVLAAQVAADAPADSAALLDAARARWLGDQFRLMLDEEQGFLLSGERIEGRTGEMRIFALIDAETFLAATVPDSVASRLVVELRQEDRDVLVGTAAPDAAAVKHSVPLANVRGARLEFAPTHAFMEAHDTPLAEGVAISGCVVALLLGLSMHLAYLSSERSHRLQALNRAVNSARERLARLVEALPDAVVTTDAQGRINSINVTGRRMLGLTDGLPEGANIQDLFADDSVSVSGTGFDTGSISSIIQGDRYRLLKRADGTSFAATISAASYATDRGRTFAWIFADVSSQIEAEELAHLKTREAFELAQQYENLKTCGALGMVHTDLNGRIVELNDTFAELVGYSEDALKGIKISDLNHPEDAEYGSQLLGELTRGERDYYRVSKRYSHASGRPVWVDVAATLVRDEAGQPKHLVGIALDVTDRVEARLALEESESRLREANKELESIVYVASHDLRSPLVNLQGFSRQLARSVQHLKNELAEIDLPPGKQAVLDEDLVQDIPEALHFIDASTIKMDRLIKGLLRLSRLGRVQMHTRDVDMNRLIADVLKSLQFQIARSHIDVKVESLPPCRGDVDQLNQVFTNLLDNAIKYHSPERKPLIRVTGVREGGQCVYSVEDNGMGIAPAYQQIIFEIFHRLTPRDGIEGEGLGLSVVRRILDRSRGAVEVDSEEGRGSTFRVTLPAASPDAALTPVGKESVDEK